MLARAAYHLGNRHVPVQVGDSWLRLAADHVLEEMLKGLGARLRRNGCGQIGKLLGLQSGQLMHKIDTDGDGTISKPEWIAYQVRTREWRAAA